MPVSVTYLSGEHGLNVAKMITIPANGMAYLSPPTSAAGRFSILYLHVAKMSSKCRQMLIKCH